MGVGDGGGGSGDQHGTRLEEGVGGALAEDAGADAALEGLVVGEVEGGVCERRHVEVAGGAASLSAHVYVVVAFVGAEDFDV